MRFEALRRTLARHLSERQKRALKTKINGARSLFVRSFLGYDGARLKASLRAAGVEESDTLMVHANFEPDSGFRGAPLDLVNALVELVGEKGTLSMVSIPFRGTAFGYLVLNKTFNVRKTISMMGLVTELFRRREGTLRSLHPTHPVLAFGKNAAWLVADHETCLFPCGAGSPFEKLRKLHGKIVFFDVSFGAITFYHYVEDVVKDRLPFPVYDERLFSVSAVDASGASRTIRTYAFNRDVRRSTEKLEAELSRQGKVRRGRVGNSRFLVVSAEDVVSCFTALVDAGTPPYDPPSVTSPGDAGQ
jgi:aminoglycoside 3-N-acetyltransferase